MRKTIASFVRAAALVAVAGGLGCRGTSSKGPGTTGGTSGGTPNPIGATDFVSQPPGGGGGRATMGAAGGAAAPGASNGASSSSGGSGGAAAPARTIQEADIYKVSGNTLFVLNQFRGLQIIDVTDLKNPQLVSRVPIVGNPVDLYVEGNTAYVIVSDYFYYGLVDGAAGDAEAMPWIGSQVWAIDVTQPASPVVLGTLPVDGEVDDTRIVGSILYVVSNVYPYYGFGGGPVMGGAGGGVAVPGGSGGGGGGGSNQDLTFVASFDISNPKSMTPVARLDFPAAGWNIHSNVTENRVIIAESGWDSNSQGPITQFEPIDISDPAGSLVLGNGYQATGMVQDRWAMDFNPSTNLFRAVLENEQYGNQGGSLEIWNAPDVKTATPVGALVLNLPEAVTAASFDTSRAYVVTSYCTDPLWIVDTSDPTQPRLTGSVSMSGALDFLEPMGNQLIALGHDSNGCTAWEGSGQLAVSLFDVTDPTKPTMTSRVEFGSQYSAVTVNADDMKKAFQVLPSLNLVLVPFQSWDDTNYQYNGGTQLIDFAGSSLTLRGFAAQAGSIERAFPLGNAQNDLVAFSNRSLQVIDASDRDNPTTVAQLDLARPVLGLTIVGNQAVELSGDWTIGDTELAVTSASTPDQPVPAAVVRIPAPNAQTFVDGDIMWILAEDYTSGTPTTWLQAVDVGNPLQPVLRGKLALDSGYAISGYGGWYAWGYGDEAVLAGHALAIHRSYYGCYGPCGGGSQPLDQVLVVDLSNPDAPAVAPPLTLPDSDWSWGLTAVGNFAWITHYEWVPNSNYGQVRYYLDRIDLTNPAAPALLAKINVPGVFFAASPDGTTLYTQQVTYGSDWTQATTWLNQLTLLPGANLAQLDASVALAGDPGGASINGNFAYVETWNYANGNSQAMLSAVDLGSLAVTNSQALTSDWAWIMKAAGGKLFVQADWSDSGIIVYDLSNPAQPSLQGSIRTEGWVEDVVVSGNTAYLPSGDYGVPMVDLTAGAPLPDQL